MSKKKVPVMNVQFKLTTHVNVEIVADTLAQALEKAAAYKHSDLVKLSSKVESVNDYEIHVDGVFQ